MNAITPLLFLKAERTDRSPSDAQIKAGNYAKRKVAWRGLTISIENEAGSTRSGTDPSGKRWSIRMRNAYGYLNRTEGSDGDHVDVYLGPNLETAPHVYVVHQRKVGDWKAYDEDKAMLGFTSKRKAIKAFLAHYTDPRFLGPVTVMPAEEFIEKAKATFDRPWMIKAFRIGALRAVAKRETGEPPGEGDTIEFDSDRFTDKGPATGTVMQVKTTVDGYYITVRFADSQESFSWDDLRGHLAECDKGHWLIKSHIKAHDRKLPNGKVVHVREHEDKRDSAISEKSSDIKTLEGAEAYWEKHFVDNAPHKIECKYGKRRYVFHVVFQRNHAFTEDTYKTGRDELREFSLARARCMDSIWTVLRSPDAVTWSRSRPTNKQFDAVISFQDEEFGRVVLEPDMAHADRKAQVVTHFKFVSWHPVDVIAHNSAKREAKAKHVNPLAIKKALSEDRAFSSLESQSAFLNKAGTRSEALPDHEGIPFDWHPVSRVVITGWPKPQTQLTKNQSQSKVSAGLVKSITLVFPSGNQYQLFQNQYRWRVSADLLKALNAGERWITVHPGGNKDGKGVPVLVRETHGGSGVYHVIGGAGGRLNYLKLHGLKPESSYKQQAAERAAQRRQVAKEQRQRDKEAGLTHGKREVEAAVIRQQREQEQNFVNEVAKAMGWSEKDITFNEEAHADLSEAARNKLRDQYFRQVLQKAENAVDLQRQRLVADPDFRAAAGLDHIPADTDAATQLSVADIDPVAPASLTLGYATRYTERAEASGTNEETIRQEAESLKESRMTPEQREAAIKRGETRQQLKQELESIREPVKPDIQAELVGAKQAVELLKMRKQLQKVRQRAQEAKADIAQADEVKAYNITVGGEEPDLDEQVRQQLEHDVRTASTRAFLSTVREDVGRDYEKTLDAAIGAGAYNSINALAITAGGAGLVDRSVVDVLGPAGAAQVLARRLHADLSEDTIKRLTEDFGDFHTQHYPETARDALDQAAKLREQAKALQLDDIIDADDLVAAKTLTETRMKAIAESQRLLGTALGEMETNAALVASLKAGRTDQPLEVPLGAVQPEDAIRQCRAIGLQRGDYRLDKVGGKEVLTVTPEGLDRLAKPVDVEELQRARRNLDIMEGRMDEENWLPRGVANRPDLAMPPVNPGVAEVLARPFQPGPDLAQALRDYIGGRVADGDALADILSDAQSASIFDKIGEDRFDDYRAALDQVIPLKDASGKSRPIESLRPECEKMADDYVDRHFGGTRSPLHRQTLDPNDASAEESLYRALADIPEGIAAYKPVGDLTAQDQQALRGYFAEHVAKEDDQAADLRRKLQDLQDQEPEREFEDMFGERGENPEWRQWQMERDDLSERLNRARLSWDKYHAVMGGRPNAYAAIQDLIKSRVTERFIDHYNRAHADHPLKVGRTVIRHHLSHADAIDPALRDSRLEEQRQFNAKLQERNQGRFASDDVKGKQQVAREADEATRQAQFSLFGDEDAPGAKDTPLRADERHTLGHAAENQISRMVPMMARNFVPGQPFKMWQPSMNGKGIARQRAVKHIIANKRTVLAAGVGSGKTLIMLSAFAHLHETGKAKKAIFITPSAVQSQFRGEAARYLDPQANEGKGFTWHIEPGASREERLAAYRDRGTQFSVVTHQAFRDDMLHLGAEQAGISPSEMAENLDAMTPQDRRAWGKQTMEKAGIHWDYIAADEAQAFLNRQGKANSQQANVLDSITPHSEFYVSGSADPVKNSIDEVYDLLSKMDPERYTDRGAFIRRYGNDTLVSREALRREISRYWFPSSVDPGVETRKSVNQVELKTDQTSAINSIERLTAKARLARIEGRLDLKSLEALSPSSFEGVPRDQYEKVGKSLLSSLGMVKTAAIQRIINADPEGAKLDRISALAEERRGKPGVIFAHSLDAVKAIEYRLKSEGHRVVTLTGEDSTKEKDAKRLAFQPESGEAHADILVASDAAATGLNLQRGAWLVQNDTSPTAMVHAQRNGRIARQGQLNPHIELIDLVAKHPIERAARDRLKRKYQLRGLMTSPLAGMDDSGLAYFLKQRDVSQSASF